GVEEDSTVVLADGTPEAVLGTRGEELAAAGVWVPGHPPASPPAPVAAPGEELLQAQQLVVSRRRGMPVAGPVDVGVRAGEVLGGVGRNGTGNSTLGLTLAGLIDPESGRVTASASLASGEKANPGKWSSRALLTRIGAVLQSPEHQLLARTVREELSIGPRALGLDEGEVTARVDDLLVRLRLSALAEANPYTLSGG